MLLSANEPKHTAKATQDILKAKKWDIANGQVSHVISSQKSIIFSYWRQMWKKREPQISRNWREMHQWPGRAFYFRQLLTVEDFHPSSYVSYRGNQGGKRKSNTSNTALSSLENMYLKVVNDIKPENIMSVYWCCFTLTFAADWNMSPVECL